MGGQNMADDRMKNDQRNMGAGDKDKDYGHQSPGRSAQRDQQAGQHSGGQHSGGQKGTRDMDDEDKDFGSGRVGTQNRGGQNR